MSGSKCFLLTSKSKVNVIHATVCKYNCKDPTPKPAAVGKEECVMTGITATSAQIKETEMLCRVN